MNATTSLRLISSAILLSALGLGSISGLPAQSLYDLQKKYGFYSRQNIWHYCKGAADRLIRKQPTEGKHYVRRGKCHYEMGLYEAALADFKRATSMGIPGSNTLLSDKLSDYIKWSQAASRAIPLAFTYPSGTKDFQIGIRYSRDGLWARAARRAAPKLAAIAKRMLGRTPHKVILFVLQPGEENTLFDVAKLSMSCSRPCNGAQAAKWFGQFYEQHASRIGSDRAREGVVAHEFGHVMHNYAKSLNMGQDDPRWFREGVAMFFEHTYLGYGKQDSIDLWYKEMKPHGISRRSFFGAPFSGTKRERRNYLTGAIMVRKIMSLRGESAVRKIVEKISRSDMYYFRDAMQEFVGVNEKQLFDQAVAEGKRLANRSRTFPAGGGGSTSDTRPSRRPTVTRPSTGSTVTRPERRPTRPTRPTVRPERRPSGGSTTTIREGDRVNCAGRSGKVTRTIGSRLLVDYDGGGRGIVPKSRCSKL